MYTKRIKELESQHQLLDRDIDAAAKNSKFDAVKLTDMKKQRLALRDQLSDLRRRQWEIEHDCVDQSDDR